MPPSNTHRWTTLPDPSAADLKRAASGDEQAFRSLVERYQGMVYTVAHNILGDHADAEDAAQEAFLRLFRKLRQFRGEASFGTWLYRLAVTTAVDYRRRERRTPPEVAVREALADPEQAVLERAGCADLVRAVDALPADYRLPLVLRDVHGLEYREVAELLGRPLGTVKVMVHRGRNAVRLRLRASGSLAGER
jgi:RNA polymerase sigma-70 factor, ECF subfamily